MKITKNQLQKHIPLHTKRLLIRKIQMKDANELFKTYTSDTKVTSTTSWSTHTSVDETKKFLQHCLDKWKKSEEFNMCICLKKNPSKLIGMFKIKPTEDTVSIGYVLARRYWNQGLATEAVEAFCDLLLSFSGLNKIQAFTDPENNASIAVLKKARFNYSHRLPKNIIRPQMSSKPRDSIVFSLHT